MRVLPFSKLNLPKLEKLAKKINPEGFTALSPNGLTYLDIDDNYIHTLYPLLPFKNISKPKYFNDNAIGAHISVIYPEENRIILAHDLNQAHHFEVTGIYTALHNAKRYFVVGVSSPSLLALRTGYQLPEKPVFKNLGVDFHITIAVRF